MINPLKGEWSIKMCGCGMQARVVVNGQREWDNVPACIEYCVSCLNRGKGREQGTKYTEWGHNKKVVILYWNKITYWSNHIYYL